MTSVPRGRASLFSLRAPQVLRVPSCEKMISPVPPSRTGLLMRAQHSHAFVVRRIEFAIVLQQQLCHEPEDDHRAHKSGNDRQRQYARDHQRRVAREQVSRSPNHARNAVMVPKFRNGISRRHCRRATSAVWHVDVRHMNMEVRQVKASAEERQAR